MPLSKIPVIADCFAYYPEAGTFRSPLQSLLWAASIKCYFSKGYGCKLVCNLLKNIASLKIKNNSKSTVIRRPVEIVHNSLRIYVLLNLN